MPARDHNPRGRRLHLPIVSVSNGPTEAGVNARGERKPPWLKVRLRNGPNATELTQLMRGLDLHTVCEEAMCPNIHECWEDREATFLILGDTCTRRCGFCDVMTGKPGAVDRDEPARIADAVGQMGLRFVVLTGVARDDLPDGGASMWAETVHRVREAVRRLHGRIRPAFGYDRSLEVLRIAKRVRPGQITKSNLILGMGERADEVAAAMRDLVAAGCDILTMGQYLQPTPQHLPVDRWVHPDEFAAHAREGEAMGLAHVEAGPLVRSSYHAGTQFQRALDRGLVAAGD
jgi:lipoic acid synthetase